MEVPVKRELVEYSGAQDANHQNASVSGGPALYIELSSSSSSSSDSSSDSDSEADDGVRVSSNGDGVPKKKRKLDNLGAVFPVGFLAPLNQVPPVISTVPPPETAVVTASQSNGNGNVSLVGQNCKQFWKAGDYEGAPCGDWDSYTGQMDHVRVHPKFLHSNATSHKWALGAFAELLDNALDEVCSGATYANIDVLKNGKDGSRMVLIEDNGGGMDPDKMRQCVSLGYSAKSKVANTIGQYGNGFKTSTMRIGADVIVFSCCSGKNGRSPTQSIGLLSYTFLRSTGKEDIVVPMLDFERKGREWNKMARFAAADWNRNVETIIQWSPFSSEADLLRQFNSMSDHGTRIIIYNLWEDDEGLSELEFDTDPHDIQLRGVNRDEKNIQMAAQFPNSRHFLTYRHSMRSYASILYLRLPPCFRIILRGKDVDHHNIVNDMMLSQEITYKPQNADGIGKDLNYMAAVVTIGFVKDAKHHIDVQGFNVYHKNRLIKPFWRLWNASGSDGRGVIGVLEANFVEPAHDKQGFERTTVLARLEARLIQMQKTYWSTYCHKIGYAPRRNKKLIDEDADGDSSPENSQVSSQPKRPTSLKGKGSSSYSDKLSSHANVKGGKGSGAFGRNVGYKNGHLPSKGGDTAKTPTNSRKKTPPEAPSPTSVEDVSDDDVQISIPTRQDGLRATRLSTSLEDSFKKAVTKSQSKIADDFYQHTIVQLKQENRELKERLEKKEAEPRGEMMHGSVCDKCKSHQRHLEEAYQKIEELNKEQESLIDIFSEERDRRDKEEENLRKKFKDASNTIQQLLDKVRLLEKMKSTNQRT
ncbi:protein MICRORCHIDIA 7-like [Mercurialis annua]|uniref:protein MICRORCHIDIA 7-like n=1 Tax=Mercurialis annua TaxID=3986 RepID=UPI002160C0AF|nr:protein MICRORCHIDIA 7-like [Mercurialis annua]